MNQDKFAPNLNYLLCIEETKLGGSFPGAVSYGRLSKPHHRKDLNWNGNGNIKYVKGLIFKFESKNTKAVWLEITISTKKW